MVLALGVEEEEEVPEPEEAQRRLEASLISLMVLLCAQGTCTLAAVPEVNAGGVSARFTLCGKSGGRGRSSVLYLEVAEAGDLGIDLRSGECRSVEVGGVPGLLMERSIVEMVELESLEGREILTIVIGSLTRVDWWGFDLVLSCSAESFRGVL
jgi:hypothetical protein